MEAQGIDHQEDFDYGGKDDRIVRDVKILVLSSVFPSHSRPTYGVPVIERLRHVAAHCDVVVVSPVPWFPFNRWIRGRDRVETLREETQQGITVYHPRFLCLPVVGKCLDGILYFLSVAPFVAWLRRRFAFDVIDVHFSYPDGVAGALMSKVFRRPVLITLRGSHDVRHASYALRRPQMARAFHAASRVIAVSESLRRFALGIGTPPGKVRVIPNGIDATRFRVGDRAEARRRLGLPERATILICVGTLGEIKGHHRVIALLPELRARRPDLLYLAIGGEAAGEGYRRQLDELVERHRLADHVRIVAARPHEEIPLWLAAADLFCMATRIEGWCNAITEALACGLPVVSTRVGSNADIVDEGRDGRLVPFWDAKAFADAVLAALQTDWDREAISARARARGWEQTARQVVEEFRRSVGWAGPDDDVPLSARAPRLEDV